jgi:hypothetical protein
MNRQSVSAALTAIVLGTSLLLGGAAVPVAAQGCDGCTQTSGAGTESLPAIDPAQINPTPPQPIDEDQLFRGLVNGGTGAGGPVRIRMACFGPVRPGETGHAFAGQTLEAVRLAHLLPDVPDVGFTGLAADSIRVDIDTFLPDPAPEESIVLSAYNAPAEIPASLELPCFGGGTVNFVPSPGAQDARVASVPVEFVGQP